jgi:hypothetical protein
MQGFNKIDKNLEIFNRNWVLRHLIVMNCKNMGGYKRNYLLAIAIWRN